MFHIWPTKKQWRSWSLPSKHTFVGLLVALISIPLAIVLYLYPRSSENSESKIDLVKAKELTTNVLGGTEGLKRIRRFAATNSSYCDEVEAIFHVHLGPTNERPIQLRARGSFAMTKDGRQVEAELATEHPCFPESSTPIQVVKALFTEHACANTFSLWSQSNVVTIWHHESSQYICYTNYSLDLLDTNQTRDVVKQVVGYAFRPYQLL